VLAHIHPFLQWFAPESDPIQALRLCMSGASGSARCPEPLRPFRALPLRGWCSTPSRKALPFPLRYYRLMRQSQTLPSPPASRLGRRVFASCCQSRLGEGPSRRYLCESFPAYLDPYPGCSCGAFAHFFPQDIGLPHVVTRSALCTFFSAQRLQARAHLSGLQHSFSFRPAGLLATQVAPTAVPPFLETGQPWRFHPSISRIVTSPCPGYASRPNRAIDDRGLSPH
jgi:hypothetical protein